MTENTHSYEIKTQRLRIRPATVDVLRAAAALDRSKMAELLGAEVTPDWPPDLLQDSLTPTADSLESGKLSPPWSTYFVFLQEPARLIGVVGFTGAPTARGRLEIGYSIIGSEQCHGYATEASKALIDFAFRDDDVTHVTADTLPDLIPSIRVMEKLGMTCIETSATAFSGEENVVRYEIRRQ